MAQMTTPKTPIEFSASCTASLDALGSEVPDSKLVEVFTHVGDIRRLFVLDVPESAKTLFRKLSSLRANYAFDGAMAQLVPVLPEIPTGRDVTDVGELSLVIQGRDRIDSFLLGFSICRDWSSWTERDVPNEKLFRRVVSVFDIWLNDQRTRFHLGPNDLRATFGERAAFSQNEHDPQWLMRVCALG